MRADMYDIKKLKCECCKCSNLLDGCTAVDCDVDFEISIQKVVDVAKKYGVRPERIANILLEDQRNRVGERKERTLELEKEAITLPKDFNPETDTQFLISFADSPDLGKKRLVDMETEDLLRLRAELNFVLEARRDNE